MGMHVPIGNAKSIAQVLSLANKRRGGAARMHTNSLKNLRAHAQIVNVLSSIYRKTLDQKPQILKCVPFYPGADEYHLSDAIDKHVFAIPRAQPYAIPIDPKTGLPTADFMGKLVAHGMTYCIWRSQKDGQIYEFTEHSRRPWNARWYGWYRSSQEGWTWNPRRHWQYTRSGKGRPYYSLKLSLRDNPYLQRRATYLEYPLANRRFHLPFPLQRYLTQDPENPRAKKKILISNLPSIGGYISMAMRGMICIAIVPSDHLSQCVPYSALGEHAETVIELEGGKVYFSEYHHLCNAYNHP